MLKIHILCALLHSGAFRQNSVELHSLHDLIFSAFGQYFDPANGMLVPARIPTQLYTINAPVYVEPQNLQPLYRRELIGPPMVSAPFVGPPVVSEPFVGPPILSAPSPYDYAYRPMQLMYDEQQDEVRAHKWIKSIEKEKYL